MGRVFLVAGCGLLGLGLMLWLHRNEHLGWNYYVFDDARFCDPTPRQLKRIPCDAWATNPPVAVALHAKGAPSLALLSAASVRRAGCDG